MTWLDFVVLCGLLALSLGIGLYHTCSGGRQRTTKEYILNNRQLQVLPTMLSFLVSYMSSYSVLGSSAEYYFWGTQFWFAADIPTVLSLLFIERLIVPVVYKLQLTSIYEYFDLRFQSRPVKLLASGLGVTFATMYMGLNIYGPAIALETATGLSMRISIGLLAGVAAAYTMLGGIRAVIWTDVLQFFILVSGLIVILQMGSSEVGGLARAFHIGHDHGRINFATFNPDPRLRISFWSVFTYRFLFTVHRYGFDQAAVQRYTTLPSLKDARRLIWCLPPVIIITQGLCSLVGVVVFAYFANLMCDPFKEGAISSPNQVLPQFIRAHFGGTSGVEGLFLALVFSASLSSISSGLSSCAANTWVDLIKPFMPSLTDHQGTLINRALVLLYALLAVAIAVFMGTLPGNMFRLIGISGSAFCGPLLALYILGLCTQRVGWKGAIIGCLTGFALTLWISVQSLYTPSMSKPLPFLATNGCVSLHNATLEAINKGQVINISRVHLEKIQDITNGSLRPVYETELKISTNKRPRTFSFFWLIMLSVIITLLVGTISSEIINLILKESTIPVERTLLLDWSNMWSCKDWKPLDTHTKPLGDETEAGDHMNAREEFADESV